jgi:hypothetical protein
MKNINIPYGKLHQSPEDQVEAIVNHYVIQSVIAFNLLKLVKHRRNSKSTKTIDRAIAYCVNEIKRNHKHDFGIKLEWDKK